MRISCLTVTQHQRLHLLRRSLLSYSRQTFDSSSRELVLVHHDGPNASTAIRSILTELAIDACVLDVDRAPLGALRNTAIDHASGELLCQWDDDDISHPERLIMQSIPFATSDCVATSLRLQFFWFSELGDLYIRRGGKEGIHGTIMVRRNSGCRYNSTLSRGEDSQFMDDLLLAHGQDGVHPIDGHPELYVRTYHGLNTWGFRHHYRHTQQAVSAEWLKQHEASIRDWIRVLQLPSVKVRDAHQIAFTVTVHQEK